MNKTLAQLQRPSAPSNLYNGRFRWWYPAIADEMLAHPGATDKELAASLGKAPNTINMIRNSDMFKAYFAERRAQYDDTMDRKLQGKLGEVADKSLDLLLEHMKNKHTSIPVQLVEKISMSALDRLGYSPQAQSQPQVAVNVNTGQQVVAPVDVGTLNEARQALRRAEQSRPEEPTLILPPREERRNVDAELDALYRTLTSD